ncbi:GNAT family N-acetyltransferase [Luteipulveratus mongoliensis]|uniref:GNAT family acetyltraansferase n=1 Tax=Luteipulveratus mongoliensis TaxID=571913 RepID=A0A0K1JD59_9MICO|nr:GNAT family N-acetyltransferase [Luteipulveratus mongoliensis]AKU14652.1 GNAT family acetyltraansferase [Luteipulveratus mongoliensis]
MTEDNVAVAKGSAGDRYEISVGDSVAGFAQYVDHSGQRIFFHTVVDDAYAGQGLASKLVTFALDDTRTEGLRVVPVCPYVAAFVKKHQEYGDIVDPVTPEALQAISS